MHSISLKMYNSESLVKNTTYWIYWLETYYYYDLTVAYDV